MAPLSRPPVSRMSAAVEPGDRAVAGRGHCSGIGSSAASRAISAACIARRGRAERGGVDQILRRRRRRDGRSQHDVDVVGDGVTDVDGVDDDRAELHADVVLQRERRLDDLVDRRRLGQRDEHHLAALGVVEQLEHVVGLRPHRAAADGIGATRPPT